MKEIESNKHAWSQISEEHYKAFRTRLESGYDFNKYIKAEIGDLSEKRVIHLQCNTGADTILLAKTAASVVGVDLVPENIMYARKLAEDLNVHNVEFIESDLMEFKDKHNEKYDIVFVSEGALCWLPDLYKWGQTVRHLLNDDGYLYVFDSHPIYMMFDEHKLPDNTLEIKYPYFGKEPDVDEWIGGYASQPVKGVQAYSWMHTVGELINCLTDAGMHIEYFHEFPENFFGARGMEDLGGGLFIYGFNNNKFPMSFSIKATVYKR